MDTSTTTTTDKGMIFKYFLASNYTPSLYNGKLEYDSQDSDIRKYYL